MIASRKRLGRSLKQASRKKEKRTWLWSIQAKGRKGQGSKQGGKKDLSKVKCFSCHKMGHYASQCPKKKKGKEKTQQVATSAETQVKEFVEKFEKDFLLVSCLSGTISKGSWYLDNGASHHMMEAGSYSTV
jgi:hypothetical protein